jgi:hypothetical protein
MSTLLGFLTGAVAHESDKRKFFNTLGNPSSSMEARAEAYNGLMTIANHNDWHWLCSQFEQNPGELNSRVMSGFFTGAAQHCHDRLMRFVSADDGVVAISVKAICSFTEFTGAAIFFVHRAVTAMETLNMTEELKAFANFVLLACESKANNGLVPRKLFEERLQQYLSADVVEDQKRRSQQLMTGRNHNGSDRRKESEGPRPHTSSIPERKYTHPDLPKEDKPIDTEGHAAAARVAGSLEERANHALADITSLIN